MNKESLEIWKSYFNKQNSKRINHLFDYTLSDSKNLRSLFYTQGELKIDMVSVCLEVLQAYFLITDDIMDKSELRRGKPCLYKVVGLRAIKDAFFLLSLIFKTINECELIGHKLKNKSSVYAALIYANFYTCLGQTEDTLEKKILTYRGIKECYNFNKYLRIVKFKTSYYTTHLPLKLRYIDKEKEFTKEIEEFCFLLGVFMQIQDDYLNFYPEMSGKSGTDVEEKKVTYYSCKLVSKYNEEVVSKYFLGNEFNFIYPFFYELIKNYEEEESEFYAKLLSFKKIEEFDFIMKRVYKRKK